MLVLRDRFRPGASSWFRGEGGIPQALGKEKPDQPAELLTKGAYNLQLDAHTAFTRTWDTDAQAVQYSLPGLESFPRLNKSCLPSLVKLGIIPQLTIMLVDVDNAQHAVGNPMEHQAQLEETHELVQEAGLARAGVYFTKHGYRLVWVLAQPLDITPDSAADLEARMAAVRETLINAGLTGVDQNCRDWPRMFRLPLVMRDGERQEYLASFDGMEPLELMQFEPVKKLTRTMEPVVQQPSLPGTANHFDAEAWLSAHGLKVRDKKLDGTRSVYVLQACPFCEKTDGSACVTIESAGKRGFICHRCNSGCSPESPDHQEYRCNCRDWDQLWEKLEGRPSRRAIEEIKRQLTEGDQPDWEVLEATKDKRKIKALARMQNLDPKAWGELEAGLKQKKVPLRDIQALRKQVDLEMALGDAPSGPPEGPLELLRPIGIEAVQRIIVPDSTEDTSYRLQVGGQWTAEISTKDLFKAESVIAACLMAHPVPLKLTRKGRQGTWEEVVYPAICAAAELVQLSEDASPLAAVREVIIEHLNEAVKWQEDMKARDATFPLIVDRSEVWVSSRAVKAAVRDRVPNVRSLDKKVTGMLEALEGKCRKGPRLKDSTGTRASVVIRIWTFSISALTGLGCWHGPILSPEQDPEPGTADV